MFKMTNGVAVAVPSVYRNRAIVSDVALKTPKAAMKKRVTPAAEPSPNGYE